jgi:cell division protein FtsI (penicillin-binding protein 3)
VADLPANAWRTTLRGRLGVTAVVFLAWALGIQARLVQLQVVRHDELQGRAVRQQSRTIDAPAKRGELLDRSGNVLALSVDADTVYAVPVDIAEPARAADALCAALRDCAPKESAALADRIRKGRQFVYVRRQVTPEQAARVRALELEGIGFIKESRRFYPNRELASHLLGYVGIDNAGLSGLESTYDALIKGRPGTVLVQTDAKRRPYSRVERPPTAGASIELTIDEHLQHIAERELKVGIERVGGAAGGSAMVLDPYSGEILALANYPTFNPNAFRDASSVERRNRAVQDLYEPGSTFKIVTASALIDEAVVRADDTFDVSQGSIRFGPRLIRDDHHYGVLSFEQIIVKSSNVGTIKAVARLGDERAVRLSSWVRRFGFGFRSSPDFPGESAGIVWDPAKLNDSALASVAIGYQVAVTPLQMAAAASSVANGGELVQPRVVRAVIRDGVRTVVPRKVVRRTVSEGTAVELTRIMESVVTDGTGKAAQIPGYTVAGKTGTASKVVNGVYSRSDYNVSFVGFVPSRKPVFTIIVVVDSPRLTKYGGTVSAPIFQKIADAALRQYGVPPNINAAPPVLVARVPAAENVVAATPVKGVVAAGAAQQLGPCVTGPAQEPAPTPCVARLDGSRTTYPDLAGMSARDAVRELARLGLTARLRGTGPVVGQQPPAGTPIEPGTPITLWLERQQAPVEVSRTARR